MSSPFSLFRKHQKILLVVLIGLSMLSFVIFGTVSQASDIGSMPPSLIVLTMAALVGCIAWVVGLTNHKSTEYGSIGVIAGLAVGLIFALRGGEPAVVATNDGDLDRNEVIELINERDLANQFVARAIGRTFEMPNLPEQFLQFIRPEQLLQERIFNFQFGFENRNEATERDVLIGELLRREASSVGFDLPDQAVNDFLKLATQNKLTGEIFREIRSEMRVSEQHLITAIRKELLAQKAWQMLYGGVEFPPEVLWDFSRRMQVRQTATTAAVPVASFIDNTVEPPAAELQELFSQYRTNFPGATPEGVRKEGLPGFRQPSRLRLAYLQADYESAEKQIEPTITDEDVKARYERDYVTKPSAGSLLPDLNMPFLPPLEGPKLPAAPSTETPAMTPPAAAPAEGTPAPATTPPAADGKAPMTPPAATPEAKPPVTPPAEGKPAAPAESKPETPASAAPAAGEAPATPPAAAPAPAAPPAKAEEPAEAKAEESTEAKTNDGDSSDCDDAAPAADAPAAQPAPAPANPAPPATPAAGDAPANPAPAAAQPPAATPPAAAPQTDAPKAPAADAPAATPPAAPAPASGDAPAAPPAMPADAAKTPPAGSLIDSLAPPAVEQRPLDDELKQIIREQLVMQRASEAIQKALTRTMEELREEKLGLRVSRPEGDAGRITMKEALEKVREIAARHGLKFVETPLMSYEELIESEEHRVGRAIRHMPGSRNFQSAAQDLFTTSPKDILSFRQADDFGRPGETAERFIYCKLEHLDSFIPEDMTDERVRADVVAAWRRIKARELARKRAEELVKKVRGSDQPMMDLLSAETVTGKEGSEPLLLRRSGQFSWMRQSSAPAMGLQQPDMTPELSQPLAPEQVGEDFMKVVFDELGVNDVGVAPGEDHDVFYAVKIETRIPSTPEEWEIARTNFLAGGMQAETAERTMIRELRSEVMPYWPDQLFRKYDVQFLRPVFEESSL